MKNYIPVPCGFYDEIEAIATLKKEIRILFKNESEIETEILSQISDLKIEKGIEYMILKTGAVLRLDTIIEIDGKRPLTYC